MLLSVWVSRFLCVRVFVLVFFLFQWEIWFFCCSWWIASDCCCFFSYPAKWSWNKEKKNLFRTLKRKQKCFVFDCFYMLSETDRIARRWQINKIADSGSIETNEKNVGKCRDSTKRKVLVLEVLIRVWFFSTFLRGCFI